MVLSVFLFNSLENISQACIEKMHFILVIVGKDNMKGISQCLILGHVDGFNFIIISMCLIQMSFKLT